MTLDARFTALQQNVGNARQQNVAQRSAPCFFRLGMRCRTTGARDPPGDPAWRTGLCFSHAASPPRQDTSTVKPDVVAADKRLRSHAPQIGELTPEVREHG